ncbi:hypothetical protein [Methanolobus vulcani]|uniref:Uncharacterized protein n=1 Tax=Methanolobus vulcani TaxID=38026 RepID=A0A7Z8P442_9EURY|nr:hypothetical protein [Methanolobus vulcani]TQD23396.1 hypothetical protein FKV42_12745 [Methanolobus vulcani]
MMEDSDFLVRRLDQISHELSQVKKMITLMPVDKKTSEQAWDDLMVLSEEISDKWDNSSSVDEIRSQREKW